MLKMVVPEGLGIPKVCRSIKGDMGGVQGNPNQPMVRVWGGDSKLEERDRSSFALVLRLVFFALWDQSTVVLLLRYNSGDGGSNITISLCNLVFRIHLPHSEVPNINCSVYENAGPSPIVSNSLLIHSVILWNKLLVVAVFIYRFLMLCIAFGLL